MVALILLIWTITLLFTTFPYICTSNKNIRRIIDDCIHTTLLVLSSVFLICSGFWIRNIRNIHMATIRKRNIYFGIEDEILQVLQNLVSGILDVIKLNLVTAIFIIITSISLIFYHLRQFICKETFATISNIGRAFSSLYLVPNPAVYILSMTELRRM